MEAYLDYNATTPVDPGVYEVMKPFLTQDFGNASSFHRKGQIARHAVESAREKIAQELKVEPGDIIFTSGGTETDNLAIRGAVASRLEKRRHVIVSSLEHQAVLCAAKSLKAHQCEVSLLPAGPGGVVDISQLEGMISQDTSVVSLMHVNNEVGTIQPIKEAARAAHEKGAYLHVDAVQSFGKLPVHPQEMGIDLLSISGHKICGPKGAGALYVRKGITIKPLLYGGHQEKNVRPGTENVAAIAGFGRAVELAAKNRESESKRVGSLRDRLEEGIQKKIHDVCLNGDPAKRIYNTLNVSFKGLDGEMLLINLDLKNIYVSTGSACTAGSVEPSHVLMAMNVSETMARSSVRFSLGRFTNQTEVDYALSELPGIVARLRKPVTS